MKTTQSYTETIKIVTETVLCNVEPMLLEASGWLAEMQATYGAEDDPLTPEVDESEISDGNDAMWNVEDYSGSKFHIGMQFASGDSRVAVTA